MSEHRTHTMHPNSLQSWEKYDRTTRAKQVIGVLGYFTRPMTDREIANALGSQDMNYVRPTITRLVQSGDLTEFGETECEVTGRRVRTVYITGEKVDG